MRLPEESVLWWHGAVTRGQLLAGGTPASTINAWLRRGRLVRVLPGVYARAPVGLLTRVSAALLWYPAAAASHRTAAWLWQLLTAEPPIVEVTVPRRCSRRSPQPWLRVYRRDLPTDRLELCGHLPTVEPEQTVLDCLAVLTQSEGACLVDAALGRLVRRNLLHDRYLANMGRRGSPTAARVLPMAVPGAASHPERVLARALQAAGMTGFRVNQPVHGYVADLLDTKRRLIIEVDGWATHRAPTALGVALLKGRGDTRVERRSLIAESDTKPCTLALKLHGFVSLSAILYGPAWRRTFPAPMEVALRRRTS